MWQAFKNADPIVKAAIISGIFVLIAAIITGTSQLIKLQTGQAPLMPSPTPTPIPTTLVTLSSSPTPNIAATVNAQATQTPVTQANATVTAAAQSLTPQ